MAALASDWLTHVEFLLKNGWRNLLQTCHKCSLWPLWLPWPLIGRHIFNFWRRMAAGIYSKLATNVLYDILTKCC